MLAVRAKALIDGRLAPSVDDVIALADPILKHRMALTFAARAEGEDLTGIIARLACVGGVARMAAPAGNRPTSATKAPLEKAGASWHSNARPSASSIVCRNF